MPSSNNLLVTAWTPKAKEMFLTAAVLYSKKWTITVTKVAYFSKPCYRISFRYPKVSVAPTS
jgi:hypothetical protein